jgi:hypothetical protein
MRPGITIDRWGPAAWNTLHVVAHTYPRAPTEAQRAETRRFLQLFAAHLPCPTCREHFADFLRRRLDGDDAPLASREGLVALLHDAHNEVNRRLGKRTLTLAEHMRLYARPTAPRCPPALVVAAMTAVLVVAAVAKDFPTRLRQTPPNTSPPPPRWPRPTRSASFPTATV